MQRLDGLEGYGLSRARMFMEAVNKFQIHHQYELSTRDDASTPSPTGYATPHANLLQVDRLLSEIVKRRRPIRNLSKLPISRAAGGPDATSGLSPADGWFEFMVDTKFGELRIVEETFGDFDFNPEGLYWSQTTMVRTRLELALPVQTRLSRRPPFVQRTRPVLRVMLPQRTAVDGLRMPLLLGDPNLILGDPNLIIPALPWDPAVATARQAQRDMLAIPERDRTRFELDRPDFPELRSVFDPQRDLLTAQDFVAHFVNAVRGAGNSHFAESDGAKKSPETSDSGIARGAGDVAPIDPKLLAATIDGLRCCVSFDPPSPTQAQGQIVMVAERDSDTTNAVCEALTTLDPRNLEVALYGGDRYAIRCQTNAGPLVLLFDSSRFSPQSAVAESHAVKVGKRSLPIMSEAYKARLPDLKAVTFEPYDRFGAHPWKHVWRGPWFGEAVCADTLAGWLAPVPAKPNSRHKLDSARVIQTFANVDSVVIDMGALVSGRATEIQLAVEGSEPNMLRLYKALEQLGTLGVEASSKELIGHLRSLRCLTTRGAVVVKFVDHTEFVELRDASSVTFTAGRAVLVSAALGQVNEPWTRLELPTARTIAGYSNGREFALSGTSVTTLIDRLRRLGVSVVVAGVTSEDSRVHLDLRLCVTPNEAQGPVQQADTVIDPGRCLGGPGVANPPYRLCIQSHLTEGLDRAAFAKLPLVDPRNSKFAAATPEVAAQLRTLIEQDVSACAHPASHAQHVDVAEVSM